MIKALKPNACLILALLLLSSCSKQKRTGNSPLDKPSPFIQVQGTKLMKAGEPYTFLGTNVWYAANLAAEGEKDRLISELDRLSKMGIRNLRILGSSEGEGYRRIRKTFQPIAGQYDTEMLEGLDFVLAEMGKRDMHAVIYLNNYWVWSGGMSQYVAWSKEESYPNPFLADYTWNHFMHYSSTFYRSHEAMDANREYLTMLLNRTNSITGNLYVEDPTIMAWQLANEPRPGLVEEAAENREAYISWIDQTAMYIHQIDPNHLVSTGSEGLIGSGLSESIYLAAHNLESIDYLTFHIWPKNWDWYDPERSEETYEVALDNSLEYIRQHIYYADSLDKPVTLEEFGITRDKGRYAPNSTTYWRDQYYREILASVYKNARADGPLAGSNFWAWGGEGRAADEEFIWEPGDDYMGDPPQEPQGLYSVLDVDTSTLSILIEFAEKMIRLPER